MLRNYFSVAIGDLAHNKLSSGIASCGLALGFAVSILIGLIIRDELTFDQFLPNYPQIYRVEHAMTTPGGEAVAIPYTPHNLLPALKLEFPELRAGVRLMSETVGISHESIEYNEHIQSADPDLFRVLGFTIIRGDPLDALAAADTVVLTRSMALKYFGSENCIGDSLMVDRQYVVRVTAVMEDLPSNSSVGLSNFILSSLSSFSILHRLDEQTSGAGGGINSDSITFIRLGTDTDTTDPSTLVTRFASFIPRHYVDDKGAGVVERLLFVPVGDIHLSSTPSIAEPVPRRDPAELVALGAIGVMILAVAGINFINLATARATRRFREVGVRKMAGASRGQLVAQFMSEALFQVLLALLVALGLVAVLAPSLSKFLNRSLAIDLWHDPAFIIVVFAIAVLFGTLAGLYPALVLSSFRPAVAVRRGAVETGSGRLREGLVAFQFAISILLLIATTVIVRQTSYATSRGLNLATDNVLILNLGNSLPPEAERVGEEKGFVDAATIERLNQRLLAIPGVTAAAASWTVPDETFSSTVDVIAPDRRGDKHVTVSEQVMEPGYFELYGVKPVAGRSFDREHGIDRVPVKGGVEGAVIINESAVRQLGFVSSTEAIDHVIDVELASGATQPRRIIGIVPDYPIGSIRERVPPTIFRVDATAAHYMNIKLSSGDIAAKLVAIEMVWRDFVPNRRAEYAFLDQRVERQYRDLIRQRDIAVGFALTSILIACFGLFGLSAFTAARRTKEIGIRKAMGAGTVDIVRLLVWQFLRPVVMANLLAWPVAALLMQRWLEGFVYHIPLDASVFLAATGAALVLAVVTISFHAVAVAQTHPSASLRYE